MPVSPAGVAVQPVTRLERDLGRARPPAAPRLASRARTSKVWPGTGAAIDGGGAKAANGPVGSATPGRLRGGGQLQPEARGDRVLGLPLLDAQQEQRLVLAGALGDGLADELQRRGQAGHRGRRDRSSVKSAAARPKRAVDAGQLVGHALGRAAAERREQARVAGVEAVEDRRLLGRRRADARADARVVAVVGPPAPGL